MSNERPTLRVQITGAEARLHVNEAITFESPWDDVDLEINTLAAGEDATIEKDVDPETGDVTVTFGIPRGQDGAPGDDGVSPEIEVSEITGGHRVTMTDAEGSHVFDVMDGQDGAPGDDGVSPEIQVSEITGGHRVTMTDAEESHVFDVMDGTDGQPGQDGNPGQDGQPGEDGYSPSASVSKSGGVATITITDKDGTTTATVSDGQDGAPGQDGQPGEDGVSPEIEVSEITGGHRVTMTDAEGSHAFDVMDGTDGQPGQDGAPGQDGDDGVTFTPSVSSAGVISWTNDGGRANPESVDLTAGVSDAVADWLDDHVDPATGYVVDDTLSVSGAAADAAKVGDLKSVTNALHETPWNQIIGTMENKWISGGSVVNSSTHLMSQILDIDDYIMLTVDSGYQVGVLFYNANVTDRANFNTASGFVSSYVALWPGTRAVICLQKSNNTALGLPDLVHLHPYHGWGKTSYSNASPLSSLTAFSKITKPGVYFLSYNIDITNSNKADLPTGYTSGNNALLVVQDYYYSGVKLFKQDLYTVTTPIKHWVRYGKNDGTAYNSWTKVPNEADAMAIVNKSVLSGEKVSFYGDSISTYSGYIPSGNATWYTGSNCGVSSVSDCWWKKLADALGLTLLVNNSWSGRFVSSHADTWSGRTTNAGYKQANVDQLGSGGESPDIIVILMGINDFNNETPLGDYDGTTEVPTDASTFTNAYAIMLNRIMTTFPLARVYCCTVLNQDYNGNTDFPEVNGNGVALTTWNENIKKIAFAFGASVIDLYTCGITHYNMDSYMGDMGQYTDPDYGVHPNAAGHSLMANQAIHDMDESVKTRY